VTETSLHHLWHRYNEQIQTKDRPGLEATLHPEFIGVDPEGVARRRDDYIAFCCDHLPTDLDIQFQQIEATPLTDDVLLIQTRQRMGPHPMAPAPDGYMSVSMFSIWIDEGGWRLRAQQGMLVPDS
jgi:hypothetical protein